MPRNQGTSRKGKPKKAERDAGMGRALQKSQQKGGGGPVRAKHKGGGMSISSSGMAAPSTSMGTTPVMEQAEKNMSLLELDHLSDFLVQAEMAGREFESEKQQFVVLDSHGSAYQPNQRQVQWLDQAPPKLQFSFEELSVPRRPKWDETTTPEALDRTENESFLEWRRTIAAKEEELFAESTVDVNQQQQHAYYSRTVTPYEKNLQVWRQLWRVLERCNCVVQLVDGRNPMFYLSEDLRNYAAELGKPMMLVVNKADYLSAEQRKLWSQYLNERNWEHVFFSAHVEQAKLDKEHREAAAARDAFDPVLVDEGQDEDDDGDDDDDDEDDAEDENPAEDEIPAEDEKDESNPIPEPETQVEEQSNNNGVDRLLTREELMKWMQEFGARHGCEPNVRYENRIQFGTVGFPNVGKSSVINVLMGNSKHTHGQTRVGVAAQPGKTKHFQTLFLPGRDDMMLCDCPGLVFPSFVSNTADLIAAGVYPIAQMRDHWPVVELICRRIPREIINASYGIRIPEPSPQQLHERGLDQVPPPTAEEFLTTYCVARSMLAASSGIPDFTRAARVVIKDYVSGKLLYCHPPPETEDLGRFHKETVNTAIANTEKLRLKLLAAQQSQVDNNPVEKDDSEDAEEAPAVISEEGFDHDFLDMLGDPAAVKGGEGGKGKGKAHKKKKGWGKKGNKLRDKDPYGCHADPDEVMDKKLAAGIVVNAGKYGRSGYTRPTTYAGARGVAPTTEG